MKNTYEFATRTKIQNFDRSRKSIQDWLEAWIQAENIFYPRRVKLMDVFDMALLDTHLYAVIENREMKVLGEPFLILKNDTIDEEAHRLLKTQWMRDFMKLVLQVIPFGYSTIELNLIQNKIDNVKLIERRNILPERKHVLINFYDYEGIDFSLPPVSDFYIHVQSDYPIGLLNKAVYWTIYKRMSAASHALFNENFGLPMLIAKSNGDDERKQELLGELKELGKERVGVLGDGEELDSEYPSSSQGAFQNFEAMTERANNEISKLFLGHVKGTDDNQGAQTYVNKNESEKTPSEERREADMEFVENVINGELFPRLIKFGYPLQGCRFQFLHNYLQDKSRYKKSLEPNLLKLILDNYEVPAEWIEDNFGVPAKEKKKEPELKMLDKAQNEQKNTKLEIESANNLGALETLINIDYQFGCVMAHVSLDSFVFISPKIANEDLFIDLTKGLKGIEDDPHITILYGLHSEEITDEAVERIFTDYSLIEAKFTKLKVIDNPEKPYEVLVWEVESEELVKLNEQLRALPHTNNFPEYKPHATIAYLKKGAGQKYITETLLKVYFNFHLSKILYSKPDKSRLVWELGLKKKDLSLNLEQIYGTILVPNNSLIDDSFDFFKDLFTGFKSFNQDIENYFKQPLIDKTFESLWSAVQAEIDYDTVDNQVINSLRENVFYFSAAKTYQQIEAINRLLVDENGKRREFNDFKNELDKLNIQYNRNYLATEYNYAITSAQMVSRWTDLTQAGENVLLTFDAVGDGRTTPLCRSLDGITLPASDSFWNIYTPPNHWNCRSTIRLGETIRKPADSLPKIKPEFAFNPAKTKQVFSEDHPYWKNLDEAQKTEISKLQTKYVKDVEDTFGESKFIPDGIQENYEVKLPDWFWDKIGKKIAIQTANANYSYFDYEKNILHISKNWGGVLRTDLMTKSTLVHELGHAYHFNSNILTFDKVHQSIKSFYKESKQALDNLSDNKLFWLKKENKNINNLALQEEYDGVFTEDEVSRLFTVVGGLFEAISNGKLGFGHTPDYFKDEYLKFMELFANSTDVYFNGNRILKDLFPDLNTIIINFWENEKDRVKTK
jgi:SPP1 gp7 family putative phage head morphogenesis protein